MTITSCCEDPSAHKPRLLRDLIHGIGLTARAAGARLSIVERIQLLSACACAWDGTTEGTYWPNGVYSTTGGVRFRTPWLALGQSMAIYAENVIAKKEGLFFSPVSSRTGGCRDVDVEYITQLSLDADGAGDWDAILDLLEAAGIAYIAARSSRHSPQRPKWHLHVPLASPWTGTKPEWRLIYRHAVALFSAFAELPCDLFANPPVYGFDRAPDRLGQPWLLATRQSPESPIQPVISRMGWALDLRRLLEFTGLDLERTLAPLRVESRHRRARTKRVVPSHSQPVSVSPGGVEATALGASLLERAFGKAGWLRRRLANGAIAVQCPWADQHSTSDDENSSATVLFPASRDGGTGCFFCAHGHCRDRSQHEVLLALPPAALQFALQQQTAALQGGRL